MPNWMTAEEISARYIVGERKLADYASRGNLPLMRSEGGITRFDESVVARYFRPRGGPAISANPADVRGLGVLGVTHLGDPPPLKPGAEVTPISAARGSTPKPPRAERRRKPRVGEAAWPAHMERRRKAG